MSKLSDWSEGIANAQEDRKKRLQGKSWWTRFVGWLNSELNPHHDWFDYDAMDNNYQNVVNQITKSNLTGAEREANQFTADESQKQRDWEVEMQNTAYQRQVVDMQKAGVNPALAMSNGQPSTPSGASAQSVSPSSSGVGMSELLQLMMLPSQKRLLQAQAEATQAGAAKSRAEVGEIEGRTEQLKLINKYYPELTESTIGKMKSELGLTDEKINTERLQQGLLKADKLLKDTEGKYADRFYKARAEYEEAKDDESKASAAASAARAAWDVFEKNWTESHNGARPSSSATLALVSAICSWLGIKEDGTITGVVAGTIKKKIDEIGGIIEDPIGTAVKKGDEYDEKLDRFRNRMQKFGRSAKKAVKSQYGRSRTKYGLK